jgi:hypothetical protein
LILRPLEVLGALRDHRVDFLVIGGIAVAAHGYVRATKDVDIIPNPERDNVERLMAALVALDARPDLGDVRAEEMPDDPAATTGSVPTRSSKTGWRTSASTTWSR